MKQYASREQLNKLNRKGKKELDNWMSKKGYWTTTASRLGPSIGQMFEFLEENYDYTRILRVEKSTPGTMWAFYRKKKPKNWLVDTFQESELRDALWFACREILDKESG